MIHFPLYTPVSAPLALQRIIRQTPQLQGTPAREWTVGKQMKQNFRMTFSDPNCKHSAVCGCRMRLEGISAQTMGYKWEGTTGSLIEQYREAAACINIFSYNHKNMTGMTETLQEQEFFKASVSAQSTMKIVPGPPGEQPSWPASVELYSMDLRVQNALKRADFRFLKYKFPYLHIGWSKMRSIWGEISEVPSLVDLSLRRESMYHWCCGKTNGYSHVLSAMSNLYPRKLARAILTMAREPLGDRPSGPLQYLNEALDHMYRKMKVNLSEQTDARVSFGSLSGMYLGASNGCNQGVKKIIPATESQPFPVKVSPKGKKIDTFEQDLAAIIHYMSTGDEPGIAWTDPPKCENFSDFIKQLDPEKMAIFESKLRIFNIPNSIYILLERMVSRVRHYKERGWVIRVGGPWSKGGADTLARCLGVDENNCFDPDFVETDAKLFDQTVWEFFVNLYWSSMMIYFDPHSEEYPLMQKICKFLCRNMIVRLTRLFGEIWALIKGGVPSGAYNTSHMDSWIMALYFFLFCVWQIHNASPQDQEELEKVLLFEVFFVDYGDDNLYKKGHGIGAHYFSGPAFADFMRKHFSVELRDIKDGIPFCSKVSSGWVDVWGATFLKYQLVLNPFKGDGQSIFLPFRESREFLVRAVHGRVTRPRDVIDTCVSIIGHAYGTYASNRDAYDRLLMLYAELLSGSPELLLDLPVEMEKRIGQDDLKKMRQMGFSLEELVSGFPSWDTLIAKNQRDEVYQDTTRVPMDLDDIECDDVFGW